MAHQTKGKEREAIMKRLTVFLLAVTIIGLPGGLAAQAPGAGQPQATAPGQGQPQPPVMGPGMMAQCPLGQQMQQTMQQMQELMSSGKLDAEAMKQMQGMVNQMQTIMKQMQAMMQSCPMMKMMGGQQPALPPPSGKK